MRSLYALHPDTVLQLHERGAVLYGQPLTLSLPETEDRMMQEAYARIVVDPVLCRTADSQRVLRRIIAVHPQTEIAWLRSGVGTRGVPLDTLVHELRGDERALNVLHCAVVVSPGDATAGAFCALAVAAHLAHGGETLLIETDTVDPVYARALHLRPSLAEMLRGSVVAGDRRKGWPHNLSLVAAPSSPELLLEYGMEPLAEHIRERSTRSNVVVRASANLGDRGLIASLSLATDVVLCSAQDDGQYLHWVSQLAPRALVRSVAPRRAPLRPARLSAVGAALWNEGGPPDGA